MKIFFGGEYSYPSDTFTLEHKGRELSDDETLASIYIPGQELILHFHSITYTIKDSQGKWEKPLTIKTEDIHDRGEKIIKGHLYSYKDIHPDRVGISILQYLHLPEWTFIVSIDK